MEKKPETLYETGKRYISDAIGNALSVAESAVDHFLPDEKSITSSSTTPSSSPHSSTSPSFSAVSSSTGTSTSFSASPASPAVSSRFSNSSASPDAAEHHENGIQHEAMKPAPNHEVSLGRVKKLGSRVQNRLHRKAVNRWNSVYVKSQDSIRGLEGTLVVVNSAQDHIQKLTVELRGTLSQMQLFIESTAVSLTHTIKLQASEALRNISKIIQSIQKQIAENLKKAVDAISRGAVILPAYAQNQIKEFILLLPRRWAAIHSIEEGAAQDDQRFLHHGHQVVQFAEESSVMLNTIGTHFHDYIDKAKGLLENIRLQSPPSSPPDTRMSSPPSSPPAEENFQRDLSMEPATSPS